MIFYTVVYVVVVLAVALMANKFFLNSHPVKRWVAWLVTVCLFFITEIVLTYLSYKVHMELSIEAGQTVLPNKFLTLSSPFVVCWIFFATLRKVPKVSKPKKSKNEVKQDIAKRIEPK